MSADRRHLRALFDAHGQQVYRRALRMLGNPADAEEAMQEVFVRAARNLDQLRSGEVIRWLYRTTTNYCLNLIRNRKTRQALLDAHGTAPAMASMSPGAKEARMTLIALLAKADEREARAVTYVYIDQLPQKEAAQLMGISVRSLGYLLSSFRTWAREQTEVR